MAQENPHAQPDHEVNLDEEQSLKYLEFVHGASLHALMRFISLYEYAKDKSGSLKPGIENVEGTVKTVVGPVYHKYHAIPKEFLKFIDRKVDESVVQLDLRVPPTLKQISSQAFFAAQRAPEVARTVASEVRAIRHNAVGSASEFAKTVYAKCEPTAKDIYSTYEPKAELCAVSAWRQLNKVPLFPQVASVIVPKAAYCSDKYNDIVLSAAAKGYRISSYLPLVPTDKIARVFTAEGSPDEPLLHSQPGAEVAAH